MTQIAPRLALLFALGVAASAAADTAPAWTAEQADPEAEWALYSQPVDGSDHPQYRLVGRTDAPPAEVARAIRVKFRDDRYLPSGHTRVLLADEPEFLISHVTIDAPIVSDRDTVVRVTWSAEPESGVHRLTWEPVREGAPKTARGVVRVLSSGIWEASPLATGGSQVVYQSHAELGDSVPRWLIERMLDRQIIQEWLTVQRILAETGPAIATASEPSD